MSTDATQQVLSSSLDSPGLSVVSSSRHPDSARSGVIYRSDTLAAAVPLWFHPLNTGDYLALFSRRLTSAVPASPLSPWPMLYTTAEESTEPSWAIVSPATGSVRDIGLVPSREAGSREMTAAASRGEYLFVLNRYDPLIDGDPNTALLQHFRVTTNQGITLMAEEMVPGDLSLGLYADKSHLVVFGDKGSGYLTAARKNWGRIGINTDINPSTSWQVHSKTGWASGAAASVELSGKLPAHGPCSMVHYRDTYYLSTSNQTDYPNTYTQTVIVGTDPHGIAVSPNGFRVYVANRASKTVSIINTNTLLVIATVTVGDSPVSVAATNDFAYVVNSGDSTVTVINAATRKVVKTVSVGVNPVAITLNPSGSQAYVTVESTNSIDVINTSDNTIAATIPVGTMPQRVAFSPDGTLAYVTNFGTNSLWVIDTTTNAITKTLTVGKGPLGVAATPDGDWVFAVNATDKTVSMIPTLSYKPLPAIGVGAAPIEVAATDEAAYVVCQSQDTVSVISVRYRDQIATVNVGSNPHGIVASPDGRRVYVTNRASGSVSVITTATNSVLPKPEAYGTTLTPVDTSAELNPFLQQLNALLYGVINGFIKVGTGVVSVIADLLSQSVSVVTGTPLDATVADGANPYVLTLLQSITGVADTVTGLIADPAEAFGQVISAITDLPVIGDVITLSGSFLENTINSLLDLTTSVVGEEPVAVLEDIIRTITGLLTPPLVDEESTTDVITTWTGDIKLIPESSWTTAVFTNRKVQDSWVRHDFSYDLAPTDRTYLSGACLQGQLPLRSSFATTVTTSGMTLLDEMSEQTQVFTGAAPHLAVLPPTAKVIGTTIGPDGVITVPETTGGTIKPMIRIEDAVVTEGVLGPKLVKFRVSLSAVAADAVTVKYLTANDTATAGIDYVASTATLTFAPGVLSQQFTLTVYGDPFYEADEAFTVTLSNPVNAVLSPDPVATCTIVNDDRETLVEALLEDLKNILNGVISGAIQIGSAIVKLVSTIIEQSVKTVTGVAVQSGELVISMVDSFLNLVSGGLLDIPGDFGTPAENLADIIAVLTTGSQGITEAATTFANEFLAGVTGTVTVVASGAVGFFQSIINAVIGISPFSVRTMSIADNGSLVITAASDEVSTTPVFYTPYVIHNQSTSDIKVMASSRDKEIIVKHGSGMIFTPYVAEPTSIKDWSYSYAIERTPRLVQAFPFLSTRKLFINTYRLRIDGSPTAGTFRLTHNGTVTDSIDYDPLDASATANGIRDALLTLKSIAEFTVLPVDAQSFAITLTNDSGLLNLYSYRLANGTSPKVGLYRRYLITLNTNPFVLSHNGNQTDTIENATELNVKTQLTQLDSVLDAIVTLSGTALSILVSTEADHNTLTIAAPADSDQDAPFLADETDNTLLTRWAILEPNPAPATPSGITKAATFLPVTVTDDGLTLIEVLEQFVSVVTTVTAGAISVGTGVITTVVKQLDDAIALITGDTGDDADGAITALVTEFLQNLSTGGGATADAALSFENILRQITGGTGLPESVSAPTAQDFVTAVVDGIGDITIDDVFATLSSLLQTLVNAITGR